MHPARVSPTAMGAAATSSRTGYAGVTPLGVTPALSSRSVKTSVYVVVIGANGTGPSGHLRRAVGLRDRISIVVRR